MMRLPTYGELIEEQLDVMEAHLDEDLFVVGPPGSGKTVLAIERAKSVRQLSQVVMITYNRMLRRLMNLLESPEAHTMHAYIWKDYKRRCQVEPPHEPHDSYRYDWNIMLENLRLSPHAEAHLNHVVVDEGQDLDEGFYHYARKHLAQVLSVFADEDQAISQIHTPLRVIKRAAELPNPHILSFNHRNTPEIAALAATFHSGSLPPAQVIREAGLFPRPQLRQFPRLEDICHTISNWVTNRGGIVGVIVKSNDTAHLIYKRLRQHLPPHTPVHAYDHHSKNERNINVLEAGVTIVNTQSVKGQEFDTVFILEMDQFIPCQNDKMRRRMYMLCTRARDYLFLMQWPRPLGAEALRDLPSHLVEGTP